MSAPADRVAAQGQLFTAPADPAVLAARTVADLGDLAARYAHDHIRAEYAFVARLWPAHPRRVVVVNYVLHIMGGVGFTTDTSDQIAAELGWYHPDGRVRAPAVRNHLADACTQGVLESHQTRRGRATVKRTLMRGVVLRQMGEFVSSLPDEGVSSLPDSRDKRGIHTQREPTCIDCPAVLTASQQRHGDIRCKPCHQRHKTSPSVSQPAGRPPPMFTPTPTGEHDTAAVRAQLAAARAALRRG